MHHSAKERHFLKVKGWKNIFQANVPKKQAGVAILISNKSNIQPKVIKNDKNDISYSSKEKSRRTLNFEHLCYKYKGPHIHKGNSTKAQSTNTTSNSNRGRLQHPTHFNG